MTTFPGHAGIFLIIWAAPFATYAAEQGKLECGSPQPCSGQVLPSDVARTPTQRVFTTTKDFDALNLGHQIELSWNSEPPSTRRTIVYRSVSSKGPWKMVMDIPADALGTGTVRRSVPDIGVDGLAQEVFYRVEALDSKGTKLATYGPLRVPKYGAR